MRGGIILKSQVTNMEEISRKQAGLTSETNGSNRTMFNFTASGTYLYNWTIRATYKYRRTSLSEETFHHRFPPIRMTPLIELEGAQAMPLDEIVAWVAARREYDESERVRKRAPTGEGRCHGLRRDAAAITQEAMPRATLGGARNGCPPQWSRRGAG